MASSVKKGSKCPDCNKEVGRKDNGIKCDACEEWFHSECQSVSADHCQIFGQYESLKWYCVKCNKVWLNCGML